MGHLWVNVDVQITNTFKVWNSDPQLLEPGLLDEWEEDNLYPQEADFYSKVSFDQKKKILKFNYNGP